MELNLKLLLFIILLFSLFAAGVPKELPKSIIELDREYIEKLIKPFKRKHEKRIIYCIQLFAYTYNHPVPLFARLIKFESGFDRLVISSKGAMSLGQVMSIHKSELKHCRNGTFGEYMRGQKDKNYRRYFFWIGINLEVSARVLRKYKDKYGTYQLAICRYNLHERSFKKVLKNPASAIKYSYVRNILEIND